MTPLREYTKIKDSYCISYFGNCNEYIIQLYLLIPSIEKQYPGLDFYIACKEDQKALCPKSHKVITQEQLKKAKFGYVKSFNCNMRSHPIESFLKENEIPLEMEPIQINKTQGPIVLSTKSRLPTKPPKEQEIEKIIKKFPGILINEKETEASLLVSVENEYLYLAASKGVPTILIPTGFGENLYKRMFSNGQIWEI